VLGTTVEYGTLVGLGQSVNIQDRFFVGGDNLRGFADAGVGPHDKNTSDSLGAQQYYVGSVQLGVPVGRAEELGIALHLFTDFGAAWGFDGKLQNDPYDDSAMLRVASGVGVAWKSPMGPIVIDLGFPIKKAIGDQTEVFRVNFGTKF
jgi:outer membrane protein insertion porin family